VAVRRGLYSAAPIRCRERRRVRRGHNAGIGTLALATTGRSMPQPNALMTTVNFYRDLPVLESFAEAIETARHTEVPGDWWIVIADVIGSTKAIEAGAYKKVNTVGVACIAAVVNVDRNVDLPFVFGGDGATFAVPDILRERVIPALREAQRLARESFDLLLRVGLVRVSELLDDGLEVRLAKVRL